MGLFGDKFKCTRCGLRNDPVGFAPFPNDIGQRIGSEICQDCWKEWQQKQMQLINHYGLDVSNPETHEFLFDNMKVFFFDEGGSDLAQIDTSKEGSVSW
jgi:Fe-S cluster biosynthesis and repair protein YggX